VEHPEKAIEHLKQNGPSERYLVAGSATSMKLMKGKTLAGEETTLLDSIGDGSIIKLFDKTPLPEKLSDVVCPHFIELKWANGCNFGCSWCYLNGTFRFSGRGKLPYLKPIEKVQTHLRSFFEQWTQPALLNSGELSDSLVFEGGNGAITQNILPLFKEQKIHKLLIVTKSPKIEAILKSESQAVLIPSFSINAEKVAQRWEKNTPTPLKRIDAAKKLFDTGYNVRIRLDPMVPIEGWEESYRKVVDDIFRSLYPERLTFGSLRGLQSTINFCEDKTWADYLESGRGSNWGKKVKNETRLEMYNSLIEYLSNEYSYNKIAFCKETVSMWGALDLDYRRIQCNCVP
jgi:spore photoproduct lyase